MAIHPAPVLRRGVPVVRLPRVRLRLIAALGAGLLALGGGGYLGIGTYAWLTKMDVAPHCGTREFAAQTPADFRAYDGRHEREVDTTRYRFTDYREVAFPSRDDRLTIHGWYAPRAAADGGAGPVVILVHGKQTCRRDENVLLPAGMLHRAGFGVLLIDLRNHGESAVDNGHWAGGAKEYRDVLGAWDWLLAQGHDRREIGLFGVSMGAGTSMIAFGEEERIAALWEDSGWSDYVVASREFATSEGLPAWVADATVAAARILGEPELGVRSPDTELAQHLAGRPLAIVHGLGDTTVQPHHAVDLARIATAAGTPVTPWLVEGALHSEESLVVPAEYEARLLAFFTATITRWPASGGPTGGGGPTQPR